MLWDANMTMDDLKKRQEEYRKQAMEMAKRSNAKSVKIETNPPEKIEQSKSVEADSAQKKTAFSESTPPSNNKSPQPSQISEQGKRANWIRSHSIQYQIDELRASQPSQSSQNGHPYLSRANSKKLQPSLDKLLKPCPTLQNNYTQRLRTTAGVSRQQ